MGQGYISCVSKVLFYPLVYFTVLCTRDVYHILGLEIYNTIIKCSYVFLSQLEVRPVYQRTQKKNEKILS